MLEVRTQAQLNKALKKTGNGQDELIVCLGAGRFVLWGNAQADLRENAHADLWGNAHVVLRGNAHADLRGNAHADLWENAHAVLRGNAHADLWGNAHAVAFGHNKIKATKLAIIMRHNPAAKIVGGRILEMPRPESGQEWCEFYGVTIRKGGSFSKGLKGQDVAILFKALGEDYVSSREMAYPPGTAPMAPDWDGGEAECGGGLHFSPHPKMAREFNTAAAHYVACPVLVSEIVFHPDGSMPEKVKAPRCCGPVWEVNLNGERIEVKP